jgi:hypothetical protein
LFFVLPADVTCRSEAIEVIFGFLGQSSFPKLQAANSTNTASWIDGLMFPVGGATIVKAFPCELWEILYMVLRRSERSKERRANQREEIEHVSPLIKEKIVWTDYIA